MLSRGRCLTKHPAQGGPVSGVCDQGICPAWHSLVHSFCAIQGMTLEEEQEVPLSWLWPLQLTGSLRGSEEVCGSCQGLGWKRVRRGKAEGSPTTP